jgi:amino acid transporter
MALNRQLKFASVLAVSVAMMAPSLAISLNPQVMVSDVGAAIPVAFMVAAITVPLLGWCFAVLSRRDSGKGGSVYQFIGSTLGLRLGTFAGVLLALTYTVAIAIGGTGVAVLSSVFVDRRGWSAPGFVMAVIAVAAIGAAAFFALGHPPFLTRIMLVLEVATVSLIVIASSYMLFVLISRGGPQGQKPTMAALSLSGVSVTALALAAVIGFLSFAGFEGAAASGAESLDPKRSVPRAIVGTALFAGAFYFIVSLIMVWAYGTSPSELMTLASSDSMVGDAADVYIGVWMGDLITIGGMASAFGTTMAGTYGASRVMYAVADDGVLPTGLAAVDGKGVPRRAVLTVAGTAMAVALAWTLAVGVVDAFGAISTWVGLMFLIVYVLIPLAAGRAVWLDGGSRISAVFVPTLVFLIVGFVLFKSALPLPSGYMALVPMLALVVVVVAAVTAWRRVPLPADLIR